MQYHITRRQTNSQHQRIPSKRLPVINCTLHIVLLCKSIFQSMNRITHEEEKISINKFQQTSPNYRHKEQLAPESETETHLHLCNITKQQDMCLLCIMKFLIAHCVKYSNCKLRSTKFSVSKLDTQEQYQIYNIYYSYSDHTIVVLNSSSKLSYNKISIINMHNSYHFINAIVWFWLSLHCIQ